MLYFERTHQAQNNTLIVSSTLNILLSWMDASCVKGWLECIRRLKCFECFFVLNGCFMHKGMLWPINVEPFWFFSILKKYIVGMLWTYSSILHALDAFFYLKFTRVHFGLIDCIRYLWCFLILGKNISCMRRGGIDKSHALAGSIPLVYLLYQYNHK